MPVILGRKGGGSAGGGSLPDPSGEPDGYVLTVSGGAAVWSPGGGSLPAWWTVVSTPGSESVDFAGRITVTPPTTSGAGPNAFEIITPELVNDTTDVFRITSVDGASPILAIDSGGSVEYNLLNTGSAGWRVHENNPGTQPLVLVTSLDARAGKEVFQVGSDAQEQFLFGNGGLRIRNLNSAPADGDLVAGQFALWFDETDGAAKLMIKAKQADGTVKTGAVNVQT